MTCKISKSETQFSVDAHGWFPQAMAAMKAGKPICCVITGSAVGAILQQITKEAEGPTAAAAALVQKAMGDTLGAAAGIVGKLAGMGAMGGMVGVVGGLGLMAHGRGWTVAIVEVLPKDLLDMASGEVHVEMVP